MIRSLSLFAALAVGLAPTVALAGVQNARSQAMGGAYSAIADDADAMLWNPAMLGLRRNDTPHVTLTTLPTLNLGLGNNFLSFGELARLLEGTELSEADTARMTTQLPADGWRMMLDTGTSLGLSLPGSGTGGFLALSVDSHGLDIPRDMVSLALNGNVSGTNVRIDALKNASVAAVASAGTAYGFPVPLPWGKHSAVGANIRYLHGLAYGRITEASGSLLTEENGTYSSNADLTVQYAALGNGRTAAGHGLASDLGFVSQLSDALRVGATVGNLGFIRWQNVTERTYRTRVEPFSVTTASGSINRPDLSNAATSADGPNNGQTIDGLLPPFVRLSGALQASSMLLLTSDLQVGFGSGYGVSAFPEWRFGGELRPVSWLPIRGGLALGGDRGAIFATGLGLDLPAFRLDFAMGALGGLGGSATGAYYTLSNTMRF